MGMLLRVPWVPMCVPNNLVSLAAAQKWKLDERMEMKSLRSLPGATQEGQGQDLNLLV